MIDSPRRVAVVGGNRIPFARSNSVYARASNQDMLTAALDGLVDRFDLDGERLGEVAGGAVLKHSRDRDLTREPHPKGRTFSLITEVRVGRQKAWESTSTMLRRGGVAETPADGTKTGAGVAKSAHRPEVLGELTAGDLGRRYAGVSRDRNPIHMHSLPARPLGFRAAIAHGMWTKARCLAAIESRLPDAFEVEVRFRKPIFLPARVELLTASDGEEIGFAVRDLDRQTPHLEGRARPVEPKPTSGRKAT